MTCNLPICTLVETDTQVCGFLVKIKGNTHKVLDSQFMSKEQTESLLCLAIQASNDKINVGDISNYSKDGHWESFIERPNKYLYKVCFHNKTPINPPAYSA
jgi:hypothetical protein